MTLSSASERSAAALQRRRDLGRDARLPGDRLTGSSSARSGSPGDDPSGNGGPCAASAMCSSPREQQACHEGRPRSGLLSACEIGTKHLLLSIIKDQGGLGAQVLVAPPGSDRETPTAGRAAFRRRDRGHRRSHLVRRPLRPGRSPRPHRWPGHVERHGAVGRGRCAVPGSRPVCRPEPVRGLFPDERPVVHLACSVAADIRDEWQAAERRYSSESPMARLAAEREDGTGSPADLSAVGSPHLGLSIPHHWGDAAVARGSVAEEAQEPWPLVSARERVRDVAKPVYLPVRRRLEPHPDHRG